MLSDCPRLAIPTISTASLGEVLEFALLCVPVYFTTPCMWSHVMLGPKAKELDERVSLVSSDIHKVYGCSSRNCACDNFLPVTARTSCEVEPRACRLRGWRAVCRHEWPACAESHANIYMYICVCAQTSCLARPSGARCEHTVCFRRKTVCAVKHFFMCACIRFFISLSSRPPIF